MAAGTGWDRRCRAAARRLRGICRVATARVDQDRGRRAAL